KEAALKVSETRLAKLDKGVEILGSVFANLDPLAEKKGGESLAVALGKQLDRAVEELQGDAVGDPLVTARLQATLGTSLNGLGQPVKAMKVIESAITTRASLLGEDHPDTLDLRISLANLFLADKQARRAVDLFERTLPPLTAQRGADDPQLLKARAQYATALVMDNRVDDAT